MKNFDTLFLDRDGVINIKIENQYISQFSDFIFIPGVLFAIRDLSVLFKRIIIVTNQQGIGKGLMSEEDLNLLHKKMIFNIQDAGGRIDKIYYCPHLESEGCKCRKPKAGMLEEAFCDFPSIDISNSYMVGDSDSDIQAGMRKNLNTVKVDSQYTLASWAREILKK